MSKYFTERGGGGEPEREGSDSELLKVSGIQGYFKVTVQFERCFWLMEHISVIS